MRAASSTQRAFTPVGPSTTGDAIEVVRRDPPDRPADLSTGLATKSKGGSDSRRASLDKLPDIPKGPPPPYRRDSDEAYKGDGNIKTRDGRDKYATTNAHRAEFMKREVIPDKRIVDSETTALIRDIVPIFIVDKSGSMNAKVKRGSFNVLHTVRNKFKKTGTRTQEQTKRVKARMAMIEALCENYPELYTTRQDSNGRFERLTPLDGNLVHSRSSAVDQMLNAPGTSATNLTSLLRQLRTDHSTVPKNATSEQMRSPLVAYMSTDGDSTDYPSNGDLSVSWTIKARQAFENELKDLTKNGIPVLVDGQEVHRRPFSMQMQYIGDNDKDFTTMTRFDNTTPEKAERTKAAMLSEVRKYGSTGAYYRALDNEIFSDIPHFDVGDDTRSEQKDIYRAEGFKPTKNEVLLKEILAPVHAPTDRRDERRPVHDKTFTF